MYAPDWLVLIRHWTQKNVGYALPFLVGARARVAGGKAVTEQDARDLLDEMFNPPVEADLLQLIWCPNLAAPVFGLNKYPIHGIVFTSVRSGHPSLVVRGDLVTRWGDTVEAIAAGVIANCRDALRSGMFSRTWKRTWDDYSDDEARRIDNLLGREKLGEL